MDRKPLTDKERAFEYFMSGNDVGYKDVAERIGVSHDTVKVWGSEDSWQHKRFSAGYGNCSSDAAVQAEIMRHKIFSLVSEGSCSPKDTVALIESWQALTAYSSDGEEEFDRDDI